MEKKIDSRYVIGQKCQPKLWFNCWGHGHVPTHLDNVGNAMFDYKV